MPTTATAAVDLYLLDIHGRLVPHFPDDPTSPAMADLHHYLVDVDEQITALAAAGMGEDVPIDAPLESGPATDWEILEAADAARAKDTFGARGIALHKLRGGSTSWWVTREECLTALAGGTGAVDERLVQFLRRAAKHGGFLVQTAL